MKKMSLMGPRKIQNIYFLLRTALFLLLLQFSIGCANEQKSNDMSSLNADIPTFVAQPYTPSVGVGLAPGTQYGASANLNINQSLFSQYTGRAMNNPQNIKLNLNLVKSSGGTFGGTATITYIDNNYGYEGYFSAGSSAEATKYNVAFSYGNQKVWHGIFEDLRPASSIGGGIVVVIDQMVNLGDGAPIENVGGSVWFKNFTYTYAGHPPTYCWFVSLGPYDCRPWPSKDRVNTYADKNPGNGYQQLGTFSNLNQKNAFNGEVLF
ncbi:MAG: hypothetical protein K1X29_10350 [Bdellovibrionales bacterium]|nr:hypothetical protein [Bdellovibrionales bacterium]